MVWVVHEKSHRVFMLLAGGEVTYLFVQAMEINEAVDRRRAKILLKPGGRSCFVLSLREGELTDALLLESGNEGLELGIKMLSKAVLAASCHCKIKSITYSSATKSARKAEELHTSSVEGFGICVRRHHLQRTKRHAFSGPRGGKINIKDGRSDSPLYLELTNSDLFVLRID